jgi:hypothetical protein
LVEETKSTELEQRTTKLMAEKGDMPDNKAERLVKGSPEWIDRIRMGCDARAKANLLRVQLEYIRMRHSEWISHDANSRQEFR